MKNSKILIPVAILVVLLIGAGGFFAGIQYQKSKGPAMGVFQSRREQFGAGNRPQVQVFGERSQTQGKPVSGVSGEIIAQDEKSITVKLTDGGSRIIFVGEEAQINKFAQGTKGDLTQGTQVFIMGSENPDGSITANSIQIGRLEGE